MSSNDLRLHDLHSSQDDDDELDEAEALLWRLNANDDRKSKARASANKSRRNRGAIVRRLVARATYILAIAIFTSYILGAYILARHPAFLPIPLKEARNIAFYAAHPDDETLFFTPSIVSLLKRSTENAQGHLLVLSAGNNYGMGDVRKQELQGACRALGLVGCEVMDTAKIQDNPTYWWPAEDILELVKPHAQRKNPDAIVTFDQGGVSRHINHRAISAAIKQWALETDSDAPPVYTLSTVSIPRKYTALADLPFTTLPHLWRAFTNAADQDKHGLLVAPISTYLTTWKAFYSHSSQFTWDRYFYLVLSRYCYVNQLQRV